MHVLRPLLADDRMRRFVGQVSRQPGVHAVILDLHGVWQDLYRLWRAGFDLAEWMEPAVWARQRWIADSALQTALLGDDAVDLYWAPPGWPELLYDTFHRKFDMPSGVLLKAIVDPDTGLPNALKGMDELRALMRESPVPAVIERRPRAFLAASTGDACSGSRGNGTLGGTLEDRLSGRQFLSTCGHVAKKGDLVFDSGGAGIGSCAESHAPLASLPGSLCDPNAGLNELDFALVQLAGSPYPPNRNRAVATSIRPRDVIELDAVGGIRRYEVGGVAAVQDLGGYCFKNLFEVRPVTTGGILSPAIRAALTRTPVRGDSGAWVHRVAAPEWCGVLVGADHLMGYALEAEDVVREANATFGMTLAPV